MNLKRNCTVLLLGLFLAASIGSCTKAIFSPVKENQDGVINPITTSSTSACAAFTTIKPQVDFLFLWDNSTSSNFINSATKAALNNTVNLISARFDYHILLAPLLGSGNQYASFASFSPDGLNGQAMGMKIDVSNADAALDTFPTVPGSFENGASRAVNLLSLNSGNGIFRQNAYTIVVVMSNQDDTSWVQGAFPAEADRQNYLSGRRHELLCIRGNYNPQSGSCAGFTALNSLQMRFMHIGPQVDRCGGSQPQYSPVHNTYRDLANFIYTADFTNFNPKPNDQLGRPFPDSHDICNQGNFARIFDGVNNSILDQVLAHKYNFWPVASVSAPAINPSEITVVKNPGGIVIPRLSTPPAPGGTGFIYTDINQTVNTRFEPTPGEPFTGRVIQLFGNGVVTFPECLSVTTQNPVEFFGFVHLQTKPVESTISLTINGVTIPQGGPNGWELLKSGGAPQFFPSFNIRIQGPGNHNPATPAVNRSGYFLKVEGTAIYSNGANVQVIFDPAS